MRHQNVFIDLDSDQAFSAVSGGTPATLSIILGTRLIVDVGFMRASTLEALDTGTTGKLVLKAELDQAGNAVSLDTAWDVTGTGLATRYRFSLLVDSEPLRTLLAGKNSVSLNASVEWLADGATEPNKCFDFPCVVANTSSRGEDDVAPDPVADASWEWLKLRIPESDSVTHNDETKTIAITGGGTVESNTLRYALNEDGLHIDLYDYAGTLVARTIRVAL